MITLYGFALIDKLIEAEKLLKIRLNLRFYF